MNKAKITFILPDLAGGGAQRVMLTLARGLDPARFTVRLIVFGGSREFANDVPPNVVMEQFDVTHLRQAMPKLIRALRRSRPHVAISVMGYINLALLAARGLLPTETKLIVREANTLAATESSFPSWVPTKYLYRILYPRAEAIIAPSRNIASELAGAAPAATSRITLLQNPVDEVRQRSSATAPIRILNGGLILVAAGRLTHQKGFDRMIELMPQLPDAYLTIFGEGPDRGGLEAKIASLGLQDRVFLPGFSSNLAAAIAGADVFVLPSRWEGLPNVVLESLALGTPVVASKEARIEEVACAAERAVTVTSVDASFVEAIKRRRTSGGAMALRASLLPSEYRAETVRDRFADLLARITHAT